MQQAVSDTEKETAINKVKSCPDNNKCFDCAKKNPVWASVNLGILLCMDCAGRHREYGVQYSFVRSLQLDSWAPRQLMFLEMGGNPKALDYFKKHGLKAPYDYKSSIVQNYKNELTKKVDAAIKAQIAHDTVEKSATKKGESMSLDNLDDAGDFKSADDNKLDDLMNPRPEGPLSPQMTQSLDNLDKVLSKKTKVEFTKSKTMSSQKGRISAKRIDDVDVGSLTLDDDSHQFFKDMLDKPSSLTGLDSKNSGIKEVIAKGNSPGYESKSVDDIGKFENLHNAKAISSDIFKENQNVVNQPKDMSKFANASSISSDQLFNDSDEKQQGGGQRAMKAATGFITQVGGKIGGGVTQIGGKIGSGMSQLGGKIGSIGGIGEKLGGIGGSVTQMGGKLTGTIKSKMGNMLGKKQKENIE